jgi:thymidylate synthase
MTSLRDVSAGALFQRALELVLVDGMPVRPRGLATREVFDVRLRLSRPRARLVHVPPARVLNSAFAVAEAVWILSGSDAPWIYEYNERLRQYADSGVLRGAYGPRLRRWGGHTDQLAGVVELLRRDPDSRRAVIQLYDPARDGAGYRDVPCTLGYRFVIRDGRLHMSTTMRSQDLWLGFPYDVFSATVLQELIAGWLDVELGDYHHHVDSLHLYEHDLRAAETVAAAAAVSGDGMPTLVAPWAGFDRLLRRVIAGDLTGNRAWDEVGAAMRSYRLWKAGDRSGAVAVAERVHGPLGEALRAWYVRLRAGSVARGA